MLCAKTKAFVILGFMLYRLPCIIKIFTMSLNEKWTKVMLRESKGHKKS